MVNEETLSQLAFHLQLTIIIYHYLLVISKIIITLHFLKNQHGKIHALNTDNHER